MDSQQTLKLKLEVSAQDASDEELDSMARELLDELRDLDIESLELAHDEPAPEGTKSTDPVTIGAIVMTIMPILLPKLVEFVQSWALRGQGRTVKFKGTIAGQTIEFEGASEDLTKLIPILVVTNQNR